MIFGFGTFSPARIRAATLGAGIALLVVGCGKKDPEPEVPTAEPDVTSDAKPPKKPPKPKCEAFSENCLATPDTQAKVAGSGLVFIPPEGWGYAQEADGTMARIEGAPVAMVIATFEPGKDAKEEAKARDAQYEKLIQKLEITLPEKFKKKYTPNWSKPDDTRKSGDMELKLWQGDGAKRAGKPGFVIVLLTADPAGKKVLGVAFNAEGDEKNAEAISKSLETIGPGSYQ